MNFCKNGIRLINEAQTEYCLEYNKTLVEKICGEINKDYESIDKINSLAQINNKNNNGNEENAENNSENNDPEEENNKKDTIKEVLKSRGAKNKRCLYAYLNNRMNKIENYVWNLTGSLPKHIEKCFDEKDKNYYEQYNKLISRYSKMIGDTDFDLTKDYLPPKDLYIEVRALKDIKNINTFEGKINVTKGHTYSFKRQDIEHYLRSGLMVINE